MIPTVSCGLVPIWASGGSAGYPVISNPAGDAIVLTNGASTNATVDHLKIVGSQVGISDGVGLPVGGRATVNDVRILGTGPGQTGVLIQDLANNNGTFEFKNMYLDGLTADGFQVLTGSGGNPYVTLADSTIKNIDGAGVRVQGLQNPGVVQIKNTTIENATQAGVNVQDASVYISKSKLIGNGIAGIYVEDNGPGGPAGVSTVQVADSSITKSTTGIWAIANSGTTNLTATDNVISTVSVPRGANGIILSVGNSGTSNTAVLNAGLVGNSIAPRISTETVNTFTTTTVTGSSTTTSAGTSVTYSTIGNILLTTAGTASGTSSTGTPTGFNPKGTLNIKAADQAQLQSMNYNAGVAAVPLPVSSGSAGYFVIPPPPTYDASLNVPLPRP
jgi:hypothetical protein